MRQLEQEARAAREAAKAPPPPEAGKPMGVLNIENTGLAIDFEWVDEYAPLATPTYRYRSRSPCGT